MPQSLARLRAQVHRQLEPRAWTRKGLSPTNKIVVLLILLATVAAILETEPVVYESGSRDRGAHRADGARGLAPLHRRLHYARM